MLKRLYCFFHKMMSKPGERGEYSAGTWQDLVRRQALEFCAGATGRILEIGCGEGLLLAQLAKQNPAAELYGVDNDAGRLRRAEERGAAAGLKPARLSLQAAPGLTFQDGQFDAVICVNVFFNMPSLAPVAETLAQMKRVCRKGGKIIFDYRNADNALLVWKYRLARYYDETVKDLPLTVFKPAAIDRMQSGLGLRVTRKAYIPAGFSRNAWFRKIAPIIVVEAEKL